jgi:hypothetical protein
MGKESYMKAEIQFITYGEISSRLKKDHRPIEHARILTSWRNASKVMRHIFVTFSQDLDESFVEMFRKKATQNTRLLILNEGFSTDRLMSRLVDLQIRTPQRFYVFDAKSGAEKSDFTPTLVYSLLKRLTPTREEHSNHERILDLKIDDNLLHVTSSSFNRLDVPIEKIPQFKKQEPAKIKEFEIDEDGFYVYWPKFDIHLGWSQLNQLVNPEVAFKALQKSQEFNKRYGRAVQKVREEEGLRSDSIIGLSEKQLRRIENGECRLTSNAIEVLAKAHKLAPNQYMKKLSEAMVNISN